MLHVYVYNTLHMYACTGQWNFLDNEQSTLSPKNKKYVRDVYILHVPISPDLIRPPPFSHICLFFGWFILHV